MDVAGFGMEMLGWTLGKRLFILAISLIRFVERYAGKIQFVVYNFDRDGFADSLPDDKSRTHPRRNNWHRSESQQGDSEHSPGPLEAACRSCTR